MRELSIQVLTSVDELRAHATQWDDLWQRSAVTHPTARAELVALWIDHFAPKAKFRGIVIAENGRFLAAVPLILIRRGGVVNCLEITGNEWSTAGELMLDQDCNLELVCDRLITALLQQGNSLCWFEWLPVEAPAWQQMLLAAERASLETDVHHRFKSGWIDVCFDQPFPSSRWSNKFRRRLRRSVQGLSELGPVQLRLERPTCSQDARRLLMQGLQIEHRGWKGKAGTSILSNRVVRRFFEAQAGQLAEWDQVTFAFLDVGEQPIAYEYAWWGKQIHQPMKISYDERYAEFSPGQVLMYKLMERFHETHECHAIDVIGRIDEAIHRWRPRERYVSRLLLGPQGALGRSVFFASQKVLPHVRALRKRMTAAGAGKDYLPSRST